MPARRPRFPFPASGDHATAIGLYSAIVTGLYRRERTGKGSHVTTSLIGEGIWSSAMSHPRLRCVGPSSFLYTTARIPRTRFSMCIRRPMTHWFLIVVQAKDWPALANGNRTPRTANRMRDSLMMRHAPRIPAKLAEILDSVPSRQSHWHTGARPWIVPASPLRHRAVSPPAECIIDPQVLANDIIVPIEGGDEHLKLTVSSPLKIHGVQKVTARRAPGNSGSTTKNC